MDPEQEVLNFNLKTILSDPPKLHESAGKLISNWRIDDATCLELNSRLKSGQNTLETGAGLSTVIFAANGCRHTCITKRKAEVERIQDYCRGANIDTSKVKFLIAKSSEVIHQLPQSEFDLILIDGCHGFPSVFVDFYYAARLLKTGGTLIIDDMHIYTCQLLARFIQSDPGWKTELKNRRMELNVKIMDTIDYEWSNQPFVVHRSRRDIAVKAWRFCLNESRPLRYRLGLTGKQLHRLAQRVKAPKDETHH